MTKNHDPDRSPLEEAAAWHGELAVDDSISPRTGAFAAWMAADPAHAEAFAQVENAVDTVSTLSAEPIMMRLRAETRARVEFTRRDWTTRSAFAASLALLAVAIGFVGWRVTREPTTPTAAPTAMAGTVYATRVAQQLILPLPDGSTATLNTASRLRIVYTSGERRLVLEQGEAYFDVFKDAARPFVVAAGDRTVTAHGTQFDVRLRTRGLDVALFRGAVTVARPGTADDVALRPNQLLSITPARAVVAPLARAADMADWRDGQISFDDTMLSDAVAEMNRYVDRPAIIGSPALGTMRVSGTFRTTGMKTFLEALEAGFNIKVISGRDRDVLLPGGAPQPK